LVVTRPFAGMFRSWSGLIAVKAGGLLESRMA
jgi:hypothetical protein